MLDCMRCSPPTPRRLEDPKCSKALRDAPHSGSAASKSFGFFCGVGLDLPCCWLTRPYGSMLHARLHIAYRSSAQRHLHPLSLPPLVTFLPAPLRRLHFAQERPVAAAATMLSAVNHTGPWTQPLNHFLHVTPTGEPRVPFSHYVSLEQTPMSSRSEFARFPELPVEI